MGATDSVGVPASAQASRSPEPGDTRPAQPAAVGVLERVITHGLRKSQRALGYASTSMPDGPLASLCIVADRMPVTPDVTLMFYAQGMFPMEFSGKVRWQAPDPRSVLLLERLRVPSRVRTYVRKDLFDIRFDHDVEGVLVGCADREETWLTPRLLDVYRRLAAMGAVHTVEAWRDGGLVGGAFGVAIGDLFTVESMFTRADHASKIVFVHLARHLTARGFHAIDCQYHQPHFARFGATDVPREEFRRMLARGLANPATFANADADADRGAAPD